MSELVTNGTVGYSMLKRQIAVLSVVAVFIILMTAACATPGSYSTSKINGVERMYRYDANGNKILVYEVDPSGKLTVYDKNDKRAQQRMARQQATADRSEKAKLAPKRRPNDPIYVNLKPVVLGEDLKKVERPQGAVAEQVKKEFQNDPVIRLVSQDDAKKEKKKVKVTFLGRGSQEPPKADADVTVNAYTEEVYGLTKQGKPGKMIAVVFKATITSRFVPDSYTVEESGSVFQNVEVTHRFGEKVKQTIKDRIGPVIPADRSI